MVFYQAIKNEFFKQKDPITQVLSGDYFIC
jgi:hypothetical protein